MAGLDCTDTQQEQTKLFLTELEEDIVSIDGLIDFAQSEVGISHFGADAAASIVAHAREIKAAGAKYCDLPRLRRRRENSRKKEELLG